MKLNIPSKLSEITLGQYKAYLKVAEEVKEERMLGASMISIFCNLKMEKVMLLKLKDSEEIIKMLTNLFESTPNLVRSFKLNGTEYGFLPELDEMSLGEYIDVDTYVGDWDNIEKAMNVFYRPILTRLKDKYSVEEYIVGNDKNLLNMPLDAVLGAVFFLLSLGRDLSLTMMNSSEVEEAMKEALMQQQTLDENGDGGQVYLDSLKEILQELKISPN